MTWRRALPWWTLSRLPLGSEKFRLRIRACRGKGELRLSAAAVVASAHLVLVCAAVSCASFLSSSAEWLEQ